MKHLIAHPAPVRHMRAAAAGRAAAVLAAAIIPALVYFNYTLNHFYEHGSFLLDTGWFAWMAANATSWPLPNPPLLGGTYFDTHFSPIFYVLTATYRLLQPITQIDPPLWFAMVQAIWAGLTGLAIHTLLERPDAGPAANSLRLLLAILGALNGIALAMIGFPHTEAAIPALTLCFFALLLRGHPYMAGGALLLALSVREDAGLHLFGLFLLTSLAYWHAERRAASATAGWARRYAVMAGACLAWSIVAIAWQRSHYPGDNALLRIYLGEPIFAHLTSEFAVARWQALRTSSLHVLVPLFFVLVDGLARRSPLLIAGPLSVLPWVMLQLVAVTPMAGTLGNYYAFPVIVAILWPAVVHAMPGHGVAPARLATPLAAALLASIALFAINGQATGHDDRPWRSFDFHWLRYRSATEAALDEIVEHQRGGGLSILADDSVAALRPGDLRRDQWIYAQYLSDVALQAADAVVYMPRGDYPDTRRLWQQHGFVHACRYPGTRLTVAGKHPSRLPGCTARP